MSMAESAPGDDDFTQLDVDQPMPSTSVHTQPADTGHDSDASGSSSSSRDTERVAYQKWLVETGCVGKARQSCPHWHWPPIPDNSSEDSDHSDHPAVTDPGNARKAPDSTESYDVISQEWVVKSTASKPTDVPGMG